MPTLMIQIPGFPPAEHVLLVDSFTIGRAANNTIVLDTPSVAPLHVEIARRAEGFVLNDPGSASGTKLNGQSVTQAQLQDGDVLRLGDVSAVFWSQPSALVGGAPYLPPKPMSSPDGGRSKSDTSLLSAKAKTSRLRPVPAKAAAPAKPKQTSVRSGRSRTMAVVFGVVLVAVLGAVVWKLTVNRPGKVSVQPEPVLASESQEVSVPAPVETAKPVETNVAPPPKPAPLRATVVVPPPAPAPAPVPPPIAVPVPVPAPVPAPTSPPAPVALPVATNVIAVSNPVAPPVVEKPVEKTNAPAVMASDKLPELLYDLRAAEVEKRRQAARSLATVREAPADVLVNLRVGLLQNEDREVRFWLAVALANNDVRDAVNANALIEGLRFEDVATRRMTCEMLARFHVDKASQRNLFIGLRGAAEDKDESVRKAAIAALKVLALDEASSR
ncbi:MAG: hypothetical protein RLY20_1052 [Verrucomicrobiota bacterium]|jgi:pSer/pThr/pTyr-binding forkhead associated (FHA) protein